jgi:competence protein ComEC
VPRDVPAAIPLLFYSLGLAVAIVHPRASIAALIVCAILCFCVCGAPAPPPALGSAPMRRRGAGAPLALLAFAAGIAMSLQKPAAVLPPDDRFVTIEAAIDHDWSPRGNSFVLRTDRCSIYIRFTPPPIGMHTIVRAEGFLRRNENGELALSVKSPLLLSYRGELPWWSPRRWNRALAMRIEPLARDYPTEVALIDALALGRGERLSDDVRTNFKRGGTYHLLVFSGLQIALAAGFIAWLLRWFHAPRASDWLLLAFAILAPLFIGGTSSVSRASIAIGVYALSRILKRPTSLENLICVAALARLILAPADIGDAAFHLTYAGAGALLFVARRRRLLAPLAVELIIVPLTLFHFHQYAIGGSILTFAMTPLIFAMLVASIATFIFPPAIHAITLLHAVCTAINNLGAHTSGFFAAPPPWAIGAALLGSVAAIAFTRHRAVVIAALFAAALATSFRAHDDAPQLIALDVGQGDAILARSGARALLVDGGPQKGESMLLPMLADRGVRRIDAVVLTHAHPDHCGGLPAVLDNFDVGAIWINPHRFTGVCAQVILDACLRNETPIHLARDGDRLALGPLHATAFVSGTRFRRAGENNSSIVLRLQMESHRALLTGDAEREAEAELASRNIRCDILKVAHHGSRSSTTGALLDAAQPRIALISCGRRNLFGHPHPATIESLAERRVPTWRTDVSHTVTLALRGRLVYASPEIDTSH